jgi:hypothetical protein
MDAWLGNKYTLPQIKEVVGIIKTSSVAGILGFANLRASLKKEECCYGFFYNNSY